MIRIIFNFFVFILIFGCNSNEKDFKLCSGSKYPYYYPFLKYEGGFYEVKRHFYDNYKPIKGEKNTGIVRIQFQVNCNGITGNFKVETYDLDYNNATLNASIIEQLLQLTMSLKKWTPAVTDDGEIVDSHKFFAFKLIDGELKDIMPK